MQFGDWASIGAPVDPRWLAVKDETVFAPPVSSIHDIHIWCRRHVAYLADRFDAWALPEDTLAAGAGDCEDFSILERALLIAAGYASDQIWLVAAEDLVARMAHAMLICGEFLLDCRTDRISLAAKAKDYRPIVAYCDNKAVTFGRRR